MIVSELTLLQRPEKENWQEQVATVHRDHAKAVVNDPEALRTLFCSQEILFRNQWRDHVCASAWCVRGEGSRTPVVQEKEA